MIASTADDCQLGYKAGDRVAALLPGTPHQSSQSIRFSLMCQAVDMPSTWQWMSATCSQSRRICP